MPILSGSWSRDEEPNPQTLLGAHHNGPILRRDRTSVKAYIAYTWNPMP